MRRLTVKMCLKLVSYLGVFFCAEIRLYQPIRQQFRTLPTQLKTVVSTHQQVWVVNWNIVPMKEVDEDLEGVVKN